jgi:hypothetical protein
MVVNFKKEVSSFVIMTIHDGIIMYNPNARVKSNHEPNTLTLFHEPS